MLASDVEIGVFGGSFDPPHLGHVIVARDALERLGLDQLLFVPARRSPFKSAGGVSAPPTVRRDLCAAAIEGEPGMAVWDGELFRPEPSYTVDTLEALQGPGRRLTLLVGVDQWAQFHRWREAERILDLARVAVLSRGGYDGPREPEGSGPWPSVRVPVRRIEISSTEIRQRIEEGRSIRFLVPEGVRRTIEDQSLYGSGTGKVAGVGARSS